MAFGSSCAAVREERRLAEDLETALHGPRPGSDGGQVPLKCANYSRGEEVMPKSGGVLDERPTRRPGARAEFSVDREGVIVHAR
jgi:hypothetical protein